MHLSASKQGTPESIRGKLKPLELAVVTCVCRGDWLYTW